MYIILICELLVKVISFVDLAENISSILILINYFAFHELFPEVESLSLPSYFNLPLAAPSECQFGRRPCEVILTSSMFTPGSRRCRCR